MSEHSIRNAEAHLEGIKGLVTLIENWSEVEEARHARDRGNDLDEDEVEILELAKEYETIDDVLEEIDGMPLSIEVRTGWHVVGSNEKPDEYRILLSFGGPACQIIGDLNMWQKPTTAVLQHQDWFEPWGDVSSDEELLAFARQFYFGD